MAIETYVPLSAATGFRKRPIDSHGKLRTLYSKFVVAVQGDIGSVFRFGPLPPGAVRLILPMCYVKNSAGGAGLLLDFGWLAYRYKQDAAALNDGIEAADPDGLANDLSVVAASRVQLDASLTVGVLKFDFYSLAGVELTATAVGAVVPVNFTLETLFTYVYE